MIPLCKCGHTSQQHWWNKVRYEWCTRCRLCSRDRDDHIFFTAHRFEPCRCRAYVKVAA